MTTFVDPSKTAIFIQRRVGDRPERLIPQSIITQPAGKGLSFESDYGGSKYKQTRKTSNPARVTFNLQSRREDISRLRDILDTSDDLIRVIVLESVEKNPGLGNFTVGSILIDCGNTSRSVSINLADTTGVANGKQMDVIGLSAADWLEFRPLQVSSNIIQPASLLENADFKSIYYTDAVETAFGTSEITILPADDTTASGDGYIWYTFSRGEGEWDAMTIISGAITQGVVIAGTRIVVASDGGIYNAYTLDIPVVTWIESYNATTGNWIDIASPDESIIYAITDNVSGEYGYSLDQGFSWTRIVTGTGFEHLNIAQGVMKELVYFTTTTSRVLRVRDRRRFDSLVIPGTGGGVTVKCAAVPPDRPGHLYVGLSNGAIKRSINASTAANPAWEDVYTPLNTTSGPGTPIEQIKFSPDGATMWIYTGTMLFVDYSGGHGGSFFVRPQGIALSGHTGLWVHSPRFGVLVGSERIQLIE